MTQENGWWPFLTPRLENATNKTREEAPLLVKQIWSFLEKQLELAERRDMTVVRFVSAANEVTIGGFWREHANGELKTRRDYEILKFLSPCWEREFLAGVFGTTATILRSLRAGDTGHAHQPALGPVFGLPQILVQYGSSIYV